jgi:hypothetical protein
MLRKFIVFEKGFRIFFSSSNRLYKITFRLSNEYILGWPNGTAGAAGPHTQLAQEQIHPSHPLLLQVVPISR